MPPVTYQFEDETPPAGGVTYQFEDAQPALDSPSFMGGVGAAMSDRAGKIADQWVATSGESVTESFARSGGRYLRSLGQVAGGVGDILVEGVKAGYRNIVPQSEQDRLAGVVSEIAQSPEVAAAVPIFQAAGRAYGKFKDAFPEGAGNLEALANIAGVVPVGVLTGKGGSILKGAVTPFPTPSKVDSMIDSAIVNGFQKGIKPTVIGKSDATLVRKFYDNAKTAVRDIVDASPNPLSKSDDILEDFSLAVSNTKKSLWSQAGQLRDAAGQSGVMVDLTPAIDDITRVALDQNIQRANPSLAKAAAEFAETWASKPRMVTPQDAEEILTGLNNAAKAFYKDPNANAAAALPARLGQRVRESLFKAMDDLGPEYADLRKRYGAQLAIEKEVTDRATQYGRKAQFGFFDLANIPAAAEFAGALSQLSSGNLAGFGKVAAILAAKQYMKRSNDTAEIIRKMFKDVETLGAIKARYGKRP